MKKFLKIVFTIIVLGVVAVLFFVIMDLTKKKTPITSEDFLGMMIAEDIATNELSDDLEEEYGVSIEKAFRANHSDGKIVFYELTSEKDAKTLFNSYKEKINSITGSSANSAGSNYAVFSKVTSETYEYVIRVENTLLVVSWDRDEVRYIKKLIEKMGYQFE